jgi:hypothetical protein
VHFDFKLGNIFIDEDLNAVVGLKVKKGKKKGGRKGERKGQRKRQRK